MLIQSNSSALDVGIVEHTRGGLHRLLARGMVHYVKDEHVLYPFGSLEQTSAFQKLIPADFPELILFVKFTNSQEFNGI